MKNFLDEDFLLQSEQASFLYHTHAAKQPIIDYHCHLPPEDIASDRKFEDLTQIWLDGDHYKWRAMRACGVSEDFCTGNAPSSQKFLKWAETVPYTLRNPLYHWTHLELRRYFGIETILKPQTAQAIYEECSTMLQTAEFSVRNLLRKMNVQVVCTTDDPFDSLEHHQKIKKDGFEIKVLPTYRPDKAMAIDQPESFRYYLEKAEQVSGKAIRNLDDYLSMLQDRHDHFESLGGKLSDHGLEFIYAEDYTETEIRQIFIKFLEKKYVSFEEQAKFKSAMLVFFAELDHSKGWVQQFHIGALRNNNSRMKRLLGPDTGFDSIGDFEMAKPLSRFLDSMDNHDKLAKTIIYNLNPRDNELVATMVGNFNNGSTPGKMQFGSGWWFLDQKDGMEKQMNALSNMGLLSLFVGMLTDSRSFLSYPRHEYFRRTLCNLFGNDLANGELPISEINWVGQVIEQICYYNAKKFFNF